MTELPARKTPFPLTLYRIAIRTATPCLRLILRNRLNRGKEHLTRWQERIGEITQSRPDGILLWAHAASVGEAASLATLLESVCAERLDVTILLTTGTVTSERLIAKRLAPHLAQGRILHQFIPLDSPVWVEKFLNHWHPDAAIWAESELWPNLLLGLQHRRIPALLLNARLSQKSADLWRKVPLSAHLILNSFHTILAQTAHDAARLETLAQRPVTVAGNLKYAATPLGYDPAMLAQLQSEIGDRPLLVIASTHAGEEAMLAELYRQLAIHNLLILLIPRHPERGNGLATELQAAGFHLAQRSRQDPITPETTLYLADTLGELGLFFTLSKLVVMGGSFVQVGGHNPIEPAQLGCVTFCGPYWHNFAEITRDMTTDGILFPCTDLSELVEKLRDFLKDSDKTQSIGTKARAAMAAKSHVGTQSLSAILALLPPHNPEKMP